MTYNYDYQRGYCEGFKDAYKALEKHMEPPKSTVSYAPYVQPIQREENLLFDNLFKNILEEVRKLNERINRLEQSHEKPHEKENIPLQEDRRKELSNSHNLQVIFGELSLTESILHLFTYKKRWNFRQIVNVLENVHFKNTKVTSVNLQQNISSVLARLKKNNQIEKTIKGFYKVASKENLDDNSEK